MGATGFTVDLDGMFRASLQFQDTKDFVFNIESGAVNDLSQSAGMAGNDAAGQAFAASYQATAQAIMQAVDKGGQGMSAVAQRLLTMAWNYLKNVGDLGGQVLARAVLRGGSSARHHATPPAALSLSRPRAVS